MRSAASLFSRETAGHVELESAGATPTRSVGKLMRDVSFRDRTMSSACQAGMVNNLNTAWPGHCYTSSAPLLASAFARSAFWPAPTPRSGVPDKWAQGG